MTAAKNAAGSLFDHLMDMNNTPEPRMPLVENLEFLDLMGVISSPCTIIDDHIKAAGVSARPQCTPFLTHSLWQRKNSWQPDRIRQFATLSQPAPPVRSSPSYYTFSASTRITE